MDKFIKKKMKANFIPVRGKIIRKWISSLRKRKTNKI